MNRQKPRFTAVDILLYIQKHWKDKYREFPNLRRMTPAQVLSRLPEKDERYQQGEAGLREVLREIKRKTKPLKADLHLTYRPDRDCL